MHEIQTIATDVRDVCLSVCLSRGSARLYCAGVIWCSLCQITLASCRSYLIADVREVVNQKGEKTRL